jgi:hypothetical protein
MTESQRTFLRGATTGALIALLVVLAVQSGIGLHRLVSVQIPNSYAAWTTGNLIVEHLKTHDDRWPRGWSDLREARDVIARRGEPIYCDFEKLPKMIAIDWTTDVQQLIERMDSNRGVPFPVVTKLDGSPADHRWGQDTEPNWQVYEYLREKARRRRRIEQAAGTHPSRPGPAQP